MERPRLHTVADPTDAEADFLLHGRDGRRVGEGARGDGGGGAESGERGLGQGRVYQPGVSGVGGSGAGARVHGREQCGGEGGCCCRAVGWS